MSAQETSPIAAAGALSSIGSMCTVLFLVAGAPFWVGVVGAGMSLTGLAVIARHIHRQRAAGSSVREETAPRTPAGHNPRCRAQSAATCRCPKGRTGAKR